MSNKKVRKNPVYIQWINKTNDKRLKKETASTIWKNIKWSTRRITTEILLQLNIPLQRMECSDNKYDRTMFYCFNTGFSTISRFLALYPNHSISKTFIVSWRLHYYLLLGGLLLVQLYESIIINQWRIFILIPTICQNMRKVPLKQMNGV